MKKSRTLRRKPGEIVLDNIGLNIIGEERTRNLNGDTVNTKQLSEEAGLYDVSVGVSPEFAVGNRGNLELVQKKTP